MLSIKVISDVHLLKFWFLFGSVFMLGEALVHFTGARLSTVTDWPIGAQSFALFFNQLWAAASIFLAILLFHTAQNLTLTKLLLPTYATFAFLLACLLWYWSTKPLISTWTHPSLFVYNSYYTLQLTLEAALLLAFSLHALLVILKSNRKS